MRFNMPVYFGFFLKIAKKPVYVLHGSNLFALLEACNRGLDTKEMFFSTCVSDCQKIFSPEN